MSRLSLLLFVGALLCSCAPAQMVAQASSGSAPTAHSQAAQPTTTQPTGVNPILKPGQLWVVRGNLPGEQNEDVFLVEIAGAPETDQDGVVIFQDPQVLFTDDARRNAVGQLWYDPLDSDPEFLMASQYRGGDNGGAARERHCFAWDPSKNKDQTRFTGVFAGSKADIDAYVDKKDASKLGKCSIALVRPAAP